MNYFELVPQKRPEILYARVKKDNKAFVEKTAKKLGVSVSIFVDYLLDIYKAQDAGRKKKS